MKKILYILIYFCSTLLIPSIGTSYLFFEPQYIWIQKIIIGILGIFLFKTQLSINLTELKIKKILSSFLLSITIYLFYLICSVIINKNFNFINNYDLSFISMLEAIILTPLIEELVYRYCLVKLPVNDVYSIVLLILSNTIFIFRHSAAAGYSIINLVPFLFMTIIFSYIYITQENILYSIICHMSYNFIVLIIGLIKLT